MEAAILGAVPTGRSPAMSNLRPVLGKRPSAAGEMASAIAEGVSQTSWAAAPGAVSAFVSTMPARMMNDRVSIRDSGLSTTDQQTDEVIAHPLVIRPFHVHRWERDYVPGTLLFTNRKEPPSRSRAMPAAASIPVLNYLAELWAIRRERQLRDPSARLPLEEEPEDYSPADGHDFAQKWNAASVFYTKSGGSDRLDRPGAREHCISTVAMGRVPATFNIFGEFIQRGAVLYTVAKDYPPTRREFIDPRGAVVADRPVFPEPFFQIRGCTDRTMGFLPHVTDPAYGLAEACDTDYVRRQQRIARDYVEFDFDEYGNPVSVRHADSLADSAAAQVQEAGASLPDIIYAAYMEGDTRRIGVASYVNGPNPTARELAEAHRVSSVMHRLQQVQLFAGI